VLRAVSDLIRRHEIHSELGAGGPDEGTNAVTSVPIQTGHRSLRQAQQSLVATSVGAMYILSLTCTADSDRGLTDG
jgi:hypothetical protein